MPYACAWEVKINHSLLSGLAKRKANAHSLIWRAITIILEVAGPDINGPSKWATASSLLDLTKKRKNNLTFKSCPAVEDKWTDFLPDQAHASSH